MDIIDFHSHMLPGIDDGSSNVETSLKMLQMAKAQGVSVQVLTPHYYPWKEETDAFLLRRHKSLRQLVENRIPGLPAIRVGAEVAFFSHMRRGGLQNLCIDGTRVLLIEMPFESWDSQTVDEIASLSLDKGYHVVLAHVERFLRYRGNAEKLETLSELPLHMQINAETFLTWNTRRKGLELIRSGKATILGSDAHNLSNRLPNLAAGRQVIERYLGAETLQRMDEEANGLISRLPK